MKLLEDLADLAQLEKLKEEHMIKRDTTETIYEYDKEGKLIKKTVTETHEEEEGTTLTYPFCPCPTNPCTPTNDPNKNLWQQPYVTWSNAGPITPTLNDPVTYTNITTTAHN